MLARCGQCGQPFTSFPAWQRRGRGKFCSKACGAKHRSQFGLSPESRASFRAKSVADPNRPAPPGCYWRGDKLIRITWGSKISERLRAPDVRAKMDRSSACLQCGKESVRNHNAKFCSRTCAYEYRKRDPVQGKAITLGGSIRLGPNKRTVMHELLAAALDKPCRYCSKIITLDNASVDHLTPFAGLRETPLGHAMLDRLENLQIVCRRCNIAKGEMSHAAFTKLLAFIRTDAEIYKVVWRKLGMSGEAWRSVRRRR